MNNRYSFPPRDLDRMSTGELREQFLLEGLFAPGEIRLNHTGLDRLVAGGITPRSELALTGSSQLRSRFFHERRESGIINIGDPGEVIVDGVTLGLNHMECAYIGMGAEHVSFRSCTGAQAMFYVLSCPAHRQYPTCRASVDEAESTSFGSRAAASSRKIFRYIHERGIESCQLVMGFTTLEPGNVWNTWPPHTHERRSEVYLYLNLGENVVMHFMGDAEHSRHLVVRDREAVLSPPWSMHCGAGTSAYSFIWGMAGENKSFDDMDPIDIGSLR